MFDYDLIHISEDDFEKLVVDICSNLLGIGIHSFAKGPDGGKDGYFEGMAISYPSPANPWSGKFIIQAKHTTEQNASCSDGDFFTNKTSILNSEIDRLVDLRNKGQAFDNYLVFTNRKLAGQAHSKIQQHLRDNLGITNADVIGTEDIIRFLEKQPELIKRHHLQKYLLPDQFYEKDIRDIIVLFSRNTSWIDTPPVTDTNQFTFADKVKKNALNGLDEAYFSEIKSHSLKFFCSIDYFLKDPRNTAYLKDYLNTTSELRGYIQRHSADYSFKDILETIIENIIGADTQSDVFKERMMVRVFVHYMYWHCDIGRKE